MTLQEFSKYAVDIAYDFGIKETNVTVLAGLFNASDVQYTIQIWDDKYHKHITSRKNNPSSSLSEISNLLREHFREYSKDKTDIEISTELPQQEISDEEIEEEIRNRYMTPIADYAWRDACKWYREQLKSKGNGES